MHKRVSFRVFDRFRMARKEKGMAAGHTWLMLVAGGRTPGQGRGAARPDVAAS